MSIATDLGCATKAVAEVEGSDLQAPLSDGSTTRYVNFDYAASSPALRSAVSRIHQLLPTYSSVHRGAGYASQVTTQAYEDARAVVTEFVGAADDHCLVFTRNTTDSLNLLAGCVPGPVVVLDIEHHSNLLPWNDSHIVQAGGSIEETIGRVDGELQRTGAALLAVTGASNVTGEILPIRRLADLAHSRARASSSTVPNWFLIAGCPWSRTASTTWPSPATRSTRRSVPESLSGDVIGSTQRSRTWQAAVRFAMWNSVERRAPSPARHEGGSPNVLGAAALAAACQEIDGLGEAAAEHESVLTDRLRWGLSDIEGVETLKIFDDVSDSVGVVSFVVEGHRADVVSHHLSTEHGIGVRDGRFCAHPLLDRLGHGGGAVRASLGLGTTSDDVDALLSALAGFVRDH